MSTETVNPFLTWAPPGKSLVIQLEHTVMDRMNVEVMRGFGVTRRRGTETGGILIGKIDRRAKPVIYIHDFEVVPCEYALGPSYVLSPNDRQRFKEAVARWQPSLDRDSYAVGYFRSHTRDGFALDDQDASLVREFFPDPLDVALLVKPFATRAATGGFFVKEKGALATAATPLEFAFETPGSRQGGTELAAPASTPTAATAAPMKAALTTGAPTTGAPTTGAPVVAGAPLTSAPKPMAAPVTAPLPPPRTTEPLPERDLFAAHVQPESPWIRRMLWACFGLALLVFGAACGYEYAGRSVQATKRGTGPGGLPNSDMYGVQLQATQSGSSVLVRWDRDSAPIQAALRGVLTVSEGANSKEVKLSFAELRNGTALYPLVAPDIRFRLEIFFKDNRSFVESVGYKSPAQ